MHPAGSRPSWPGASHLLAVLMGNLIVLVPMTLNAHPGTAYGIPFPVLLRATFGTRGANIPALTRAIVATLSTNIAANVVSPANDFSYLAMRKIVPAPIAVAEAEISSD